MRHNVCREPPCPFDAVTVKSAWPPMKVSMNSSGQSEYVNVIFEKEFGRFSRRLRELECRQDSMDISGRAKTVYVKDFASSEEAVDMLRELFNATRVEAQVTICFADQATAETLLQTIGAINPRIQASTGFIFLSATVTTVIIYPQQLCCHVSSCVLKHIAIICNILPCFTATLPTLPARHCSLHPSCPPGCG